MQFETRVSDGEVRVKHLEEGHTYVFTIGEGGLLSEGSYRTEPFVGHGAQDFLSAARDVAGKAYAASHAASLAASLGAKQP
jgi:hypothetical protein